MAQAKVHEYKVQMSCEGCSKAIERVLSKFMGKGVDNIDISLADQSVKVTTTLTADEILNVIKKSGKTVEFVSST